MNSTTSEYLKKAVSAALDNNDFNSVKDLLEILTPAQSTEAVAPTPAEPPPEPSPIPFETGAELFDYENQKALIPVPETSTSWSMFVVDHYLPHLRSKGVYVFTSNQIIRFVDALFSDQAHFSSYHKKRSRLTDGLRILVDQHVLGKNAKYVYTIPAEALVDAYEPIKSKPDLQTDGSRSFVSMRLTDPNPYALNGMNY